MQGRASSLHQREPWITSGMSLLASRSPPEVADKASLQEADYEVSSDFSARLAAATRLDSSDDEQHQNTDELEPFLSGPAAEMHRAVCMNAYDQVTDLVIDHGFLVTHLANFLLELSIKILETYL